MTQETTVNKPSSIEELRLSMELKGTIQRIGLYGAFVDIGIGVNSIYTFRSLASRMSATLKM